MLEQAAQSGAHQDRDQPVGSFGNADVTGEAQAFGPCPGVGGDGSHHQADQGKDERRLVVTGAREEHRESPEDCRVAKAIQGAVKERAEPGGALGEPGHVAVDEVAEHERRDHEHTGDQTSLWEEHQSSRAHAERADQRDRVRTDAEPQQELGDR